jgi:hypothetical protein
MMPHRETETEDERDRELVLFMEYILRGMYNGEQGPID